MAYEKLDLQDGTVLKAEHVNHMEEGIEKANSVIETVGGTEKIKQDALPEALQFGKNKIETLTWDGNTDGLVSVAGVLYKLSDDVPTMADLQNGAEAVAITGDSETIYTFSVDNSTIVEGEGFIMLSAAETGIPLVIISEYDGAIIEGLTMPEKGVYFYKEGDYPVAKSFSIPDYEFLKIKKIEDEYIPNAYRATLYIDFGERVYLYMDAALTTKATLEQVMRMAATKNVTIEARIGEMIVAHFAPLYISIGDGFMEIGVVFNIDDAGKITTAKFYTAEYTPT